MSYMHIYVYTYTAHLYICINIHICMYTHIHTQIHTMYVNKHTSVFVDSVLAVILIHKYCEALKYVHAYIFI
jgi:hypothetical protein